MNAKAQFIFDDVVYQWSGWLGCQLESFEWRTVPAGTTRRLEFSHPGDWIDMTVYSTRRDGFKVRTAWAVSKSGTIDEQTARIEQLRSSLQNLI